MRVMAHFLLWRLGLAKAWTFYTADECGTLEKYAAGKKRLAEIGCWQGVNTARIRRAMAPDAVLFAVDPYPAGALGFSAARAIAQEEAGKAANGKIEWLRLTDLEAARTPQVLAAPFDFIFSDSHNSYEGFRKTWEAWSPLIGKGGIYILANSATSPEKPIEGAGSVRFTNERILTDARFKKIETVGSFTVLKRG